MTRPTYAITTCGGRKAPGPAPAAKFYKGTFFRDQLRTAVALQPRKGVLILSNVYGYMRPYHIVPGPYNSHWGYPDTMPDDQLLQQVETLDLTDGGYVVNLGAVEYAHHTRRLFPDSVDVVHPASGLPTKTIGYQQQLHATMRKLKKVPPKYMIRM